MDFDEKYIVTGSVDRTIKVWSTSSCELIRTLKGHESEVACLQYRDRLIVSSSLDKTIRVWDIESGRCLRVLEGHEEFIRCVRFDSKRIVSGSSIGEIKVWDLVAALDPRALPGTLCIKTLYVSPSFILFLNNLIYSYVNFVSLQGHTVRVIRFHFDEFQIVSCSLDDNILIWDFSSY